MAEKNFWETSGSVTEMSVYVRCAAKTSGLDFTKSHFVGILGYLIIIRSMALVQTAWLWPLPAFTKHLPSGAVCLWQCSCSVHKTQFAKPWQLAATTYTWSSRKSLLSAELLSQECASHPCCCELTLALAFYGCWRTGNSSEKGDGRSRSTFVLLSEADVCHTHCDPSGSYSPPVIFLSASLWNILSQFGGLSLFPVSSHTKTYFS